MDQKAYIHLQEEKDGHKYSFSMEMGAPLADAAEVSFRMFKSCDKLYRDAIDKAIKEHEDKEAKAKELEAK